MIGDVLTWQSPGQAPRTFIRGFAMINDSGTLFDGAATVTLTSFNSTTITSTLTLSQSLIQIPENGINITCIDVGTVTAQIAGT